MFERFTDRARRVVVLAQEEARLLNHNYIGTEHILLGLLNEGEGIAAQALESLDIDLASVREEVVKISSLKALAYSEPAMTSSNRSASLGSSRFRRDRGDTSIG